MSRDGTIFSPLLLRKHQVNLSIYLFFWHQLTMAYSQQPGTYPPGGYPGQPAGGYPGQPAGGYPGQPAGAYPVQGGYPEQTPPTGYQGYAGETCSISIAPTCALRKFVFLRACAVPNRLTPPLFFSPYTGGPPPGVDPTFYAWFTAVDTDHSGSISLPELQRVLSNNNWSNFSEDTCRMMISECQRSQFRA